MHLKPSSHSWSGPDDTASFNKILDWLDRINVSVSESAQDTSIPGREALRDTRPSTPSVQLHLDTSRALLTPAEATVSPSTTDHALPDIFDAPECSILRNKETVSLTSQLSSARSIFWDGEDNTTQKQEQAISAESIHIKKDRACKTIVWVTDCLQCVLKKLPCDKTVPQCNRCRRSGKPDECLVQAVQHRNHLQLPKLLQLSGYDNFGSWERKMKLQEEVKETHLCNNFA
jgi:hypothetical protein